MTEREKRLRRELLASRRLRQKSRATVGERMSTKVLMRGGESLDGFRIVKGAVQGLNTSGTLNGFCVRVKPLNKNQRRAFFHWCHKHNLAVKPVEFGLVEGKGREGCVKDESLATVYFVGGNGELAAQGLRTIYAHDYVLDCFQVGTASHRMSEPSETAQTHMPYRKPKVVVRAKNDKLRTKTSRMAVTHAEVEEQTTYHFGRPKTKKVVVARWTQVKS